MGITTRDRQPKKSFDVVQKQFALAPYFPLPQTPKVSVVVASYNGDRTLRACLESLERLNYPNFEIILVDDGSTDSTAQVVATYKTVRCFRARNRFQIRQSPAVWHRPTFANAPDNFQTAFADANKR